LTNSVTAFCSVIGSRTLKISASRSSPGFHGDWLAPGGHGLDDLQVDGESTEYAGFLHLSERLLPARFTVYRDVMQHDPPTRAVLRKFCTTKPFT